MCIRRWVSEPTTPISWISSETNPLLSSFMLPCLDQGLSTEHMFRQPGCPSADNPASRGHEPLSLFQSVSEDESIFPGIFPSLGLLVDGPESAFSYPATDSLDFFDTGGHGGAEQGLSIPSSGPSSLYPEYLTCNDQVSLEADFNNVERLLSLSPMDRWKNSPPETEPAHLTDIMSSVARSISANNQIPQEELISPTTPNRRTRTRRPRLPTPSIAASESSASSSSVSSAHSLGSNHSGSFGRFYAKEPKRRRNRRQRKKSPTSQIRCRKQTQQRPFQCTFCTDTFKSKHDWTRHEKTLHLSLESWVCAPFGPTYEDELSNVLRCVFCDIEAPSDEHIQAHRYLECQEKPSALRTFYRKDHLLQHLRLVHDTQNHVTCIPKWKSEVTHINSRCGFCSATFTVWSDRNDHLAAHYRQGTLIKDWKGCRGLDPAVVLAVDNAMPPYLIGAESTGIYPFSASRRKRSIGYGEFESYRDQPQNTENTAPTPFEQLTEHLIRLVSERQDSGLPITDEFIQREARIFVFGDDDPWNQTAADSPDWLDFFKDGMGLGPACVMNVDAAHHPKPVFHLPWDINTQRGHDSQKIIDASSRSPMVPATSWTPWSWQSPECLAEFRRFNCDAGSSSKTQGEWHYRDE